MPKTDDIPSIPLADARNLVGQEVRIHEQFAGCEYGYDGVLNAVIDPPAVKAGEKPKFGHALRLTVAPPSDHPDYLRRDMPKYSLSLHVPLRSVTSLTPKAGG